MTDVAKRQRSESASSESTTASKRMKGWPTSQNHEAPARAGPESVGNDKFKTRDVKSDKIKAKDGVSGAKKWKAWSAHSASTPYPDFGHPTNRECQLAYDILHEMHNDAVEAEFEDENTPETIPFVLDAMIVAVLSQATTWSNAKRAMDCMNKVYGSIFCKLQEAIRCGGLYIRKTKTIMSILEDIKSRYGRWNLDHLLDASDEDAMKELISYKNPFTVDTHVYRIAGLWGWRPKEATREKTQSRLDAVIPLDLKFKLHFFLIQHGRDCPACRGGTKSDQICEVHEKLKKQLEAIA
ncbi:hypothetical protein T440DRAFT_499402 [Plenodomus tracheiphilus IPT5]|uniref:HhH-GPD domain-containing protein n=1 Tax=Plenodomus tracheiphilus IPT5 TaxID=1408161 RepID=A0A6A7B616_9PLEO|nr:hypothetical protein T440DRAFT_499402 [Plenodomus tracheiphilus IPT5]